MTPVRQAGVGQPLVSHHLKILRSAGFEHAPHTDHDHAHGEGCGHAAVSHGDHVDYVHDGHRHAAHDGHYDEH